MLNLKIEAIFILNNKMNFRLLILSTLTLLFASCSANQNGEVTIWTHALDFGRGFVAGFVNQDLSHAGHCTDAFTIFRENFNNITQ